MNGIQYFQRLGNAIQSEWRAKNFRSAEFPEIAYRMLSENPPALHYNSILRWVLRKDSVPSQDPDADFGQPPVTVFTAPQFFIEALFWLDGTTSIHQHAFSGAFHVLAGSSIQSRYLFNKREFLSSRMLLGELKLQESTYLSSGDTERILAGSQFIHSLFHLDYPSVTIVVRTIREPEYAPQYDYRPPFLALDPFSIPPLTKRRLQILDTLQKISKSRYKNQIRELLLDSDFETAYLLLDHCHPNLSESEFEVMIGIAKRMHGSLVDLIVPVVQEALRQQHVVSMRAEIRNPEHRFFLALLLNLKDRQSIMRFLRKRYTDAPMAMIEKWIHELSRTKPGSGRQNAFGIYWDEVTDRMMHLMLARKTFPSILKEFEKAYTEKQVRDQKSDLYELYSAFRNSIFKPLFQEFYKSPPLSRLSSSK